ncbi:hypothetical protein LCGC14_1271110 [marine sediment metagenome]|uniref:Uncharacterized protein n=1 Tax=marine sediment metagenome TaxID=412755 RepID=A0A0F9KZV0_9ZZZZ
MSDNKKRGLYAKYRPVERTDGRSAPGEKHHGCEYFVLDLTHDPHALPAIQAYANSCGADYPQLAVDILDRARGGGTTE